MEKISKKKSLGQHFLHSQHYLRLIADTAQLNKDERVLEVGPGDGALTTEILARGARVLAVEKDRRLISVLAEKFAREIKNDQLKIIEADILDLDVSQYFAKNQKYKIVANIPYYISGAIFKKFLSEAQQPSSMVLLIQKEVAQRIARAKKESILSLSVKAYCTPKYVKTVPAGAFAPPPKVDSAILALYDISKKNFESEKQEKRFFELVRAGFAQKRKLLRRNLESVLGKSAEEKLKGVARASDARAEDVPLEKWLQISRF